MPSTILSADERAPDVQALYRHHHGWLERWLLRRTGCSAQAAELAQDTFVRLMVRRRQPAASSSMRHPRAFLATIARGLLIDEWRRRDIERAWLDTLAAQAEAYAPSPEVTLLIVDSLARIDAMLDGLRAPVREAFLLARLDGLTCAQIAQRQGLSSRTVERYLAAALRHCHDVLHAESRW